MVDWDLKETNPASQTTIDSPAVDPAPVALDRLANSPRPRILPAVPGHADNPRIGFNEVTPFRADRRASRLRASRNRPRRRANPTPAAVPPIAIPPADRQPNEPEKSSQHMVDSALKKIDSPSQTAPGKPAEPPTVSPKSGGAGGLSTSTKENEAGVESTEIQPTDSQPNEPEKSPQPRLVPNLGTLDPARQAELDRLVAAAAQAWSEEADDADDCPETLEEAERDLDHLRGLPGFDTMTPEEFLEARRELRRVMDEEEEEEEEDEDDESTDSDQSPDRIPET